MTNEKMVAELVERGALRSDIVKQAFLHIDRVNFVLESEQKQAYGDYPLPISEKATISQPYTVALMLEWLAAKKGEKILEVGSGSWWVVALLGYIVGPKWNVYGTELDMDLVVFGEMNVKKSDVHNVIIKEADDILGWPGKAPFDRIIVSAAAGNIPGELIEQLKIGGRMVIPIKHSIYVIDKKSETDIEWDKFDGFVFVPLIE